MMKMSYDDLYEVLKSVSDGVAYEVTLLSNMSAVIYDALDDLNWCGFYLVRDKKLILGPFQGKVACSEICFDRGVCGAAASADKTVLVEDVHQFPGHIACDSASNSEIVIPVHKNGALYGVLDIDSPIFSRFHEEDKAGLESLAELLESFLARL